MEEPLLLNDYQQRAMSTCMPSCDNFAYMFLNFVGEVGEVASKIAKSIRKGEMEILNNELSALNFYDGETSAKADDALKAELGDCLWQLAGLAHVCGWTLQEVAEQNLAKLASRKERNMIDGNGDNR